MFWPLKSSAKAPSIRMARHKELTQMSILSPALALAILAYRLRDLL